MTARGWCRWAIWRLTAGPAKPQAPDTRWRGWYQYFPWEDWRDSKPAMIDSAILPALKKFVKDAPNAETAELRRDRMRCLFRRRRAWDEEKVLERYELLYEAGLVEEFCRDSGKPAKAAGAGHAPCCSIIAASWPPPSPGCAAS